MSYHWQDNANVIHMIHDYLYEVAQLAALMDIDAIRRAVHLLRALSLTSGGRLFILGNGGSAANASHAVNDFRKMVNIEAYAPADNAAELTARINDSADGWNGAYREWLKVSRLRITDVLLILSVGGGQRSGLSSNLVEAMTYARKQEAKIVSIVSRNGGAAKELSDVCILIPVISEEHVTQHAESFQAIVWHLLVLLAKIRGS